MLHVRESCSSTHERIYNIEKLGVTESTGSMEVWKLLHYMYTYPLKIILDTCLGVGACSGRYSIIHVHCSYLKGVVVKSSKHSCDFKKITSNKSEIGGGGEGGGVVGHPLFTLWLKPCVYCTLLYLYVYVYSVHACNNSIIFCRLVATSLGMRLELRPVLRQESSPRVRRRSLL